MLRLPLAAALAGTLLVVACDDPSGRRSDATHAGAGVADSLAARIALGEGTVVDMRALAPFRWERLHIFPPHADAATIRGELGAEWEGAAKRLRSDDRVSLLVFVDSGQVVASIEQPRANGDFSLLYRKGGWTAKSAKFRVRRTHTTPDGNPNYILIRADSIVGR